MHDLFWAIFEKFIILLEGIIVIPFAHSFFSLNLRNTKCLKNCTLGILIFSVTEYLINKAVIFEGFAGVLYSIVVFIYLILAVDGNIWKKFFISVIANVFMMVASLVTLSLFAHIMQNSIQVFIIESDLNRVVAVIFSKALLAYLCYMFKSLNKSNKFALKKMEWGLVITVLVITFSLFMFIYNVQLIAVLENRANLFLMLTELGLLLINIVCIYMIITLSKNNRTESENAALKQQIEYQQQYAHKVKIEETEMHKIRHDFKNNMNILKSLLKKGDYDGLEGYFQKYESSTILSESSIYTGNQFIDAILNIKLSYAKSLGIETFCSTIKDFGSINDVDLCNLIGNLLDNAIEACNKVESRDKILNVNIFSNSGEIVIRVENSVSESVLAANPKLKTTKRGNRGEHGYGVKNIKSIYQKYDGEFDRYEENNLFCCVVVLRSDLEE